MPLLQFTTSVAADGDDWQSFAETVADLYAKHMQTDRGHIAVEFHRVPRDDMWLGRQVPGDLLFLDAEIREGRTHERRRAFALAVMDDAASRWDVPEQNQKVVFTEHEGALMMGYDRVGSAWTPDEAGDS